MKNKGTDRNTTIVIKAMMTKESRLAKSIKQYVIAGCKATLFSVNWSFDIYSETISKRLVQPIEIITKA